MKRLKPEKLLTIIASEVLEKRLVELVRKARVSGYTVIEARGAGSSGEQTGMLDIDTNIEITVILPESRVATVLDPLERMIRNGHHLKVFVSDVSVLMPEHYERPVDWDGGED